MLTESDIVTLADAFAKAEGIPETTVSDRAMGDSKRIPLLRVGAGITLRRANEVLCWFSDNWPKRARWPKRIERPKPMRNRPPMPKSRAPR